jgi:class 3 adenylate cyclase
MAIREDIIDKVAEIFRAAWTERDGYVVPEPDSLTLDNDAVNLNGTVLYADMAESTNLVDSKKNSFAAEIYKTFLHCAAKVIRDEDGEITAYDGDRIMAVFLGDGKNDRAARTGLKINNARIEIIDPAIKAQYPKSTYRVKHKVGIDTSSFFVARTGVRGANDLVWVGRAANHAAKLCTFSSEYPTRITSEVYDALSRNMKYSSKGTSMWEKITWTDMKRVYYRSSWQWPI